MANELDAQKIIQVGFDLWDEKPLDPLDLTYTFLNSYPSYYKTSFFDLSPNQINILDDLMSITMPLPVP